jgi:chromatin modification-related protein EAF6
MAETAPPATAAAATTANGAGTAAAITTAAASSNTGGATTDQNQNRGLPYYEKLRRDLRDTLQKKRLMDKSMV